MNDASSSDETYRFDKPGTLSKPGPIGRVVRLGMGALCLYLVYTMIFRADIRDIDNLFIWAWAIFGLWWLAPPVINIGFGKTWNAWKIRGVFAGIGVAAAIVSFVMYGDFLAEPLWWFLKPWIIYLYGHLGISFVLASILATPGCEMRSIPHLIGIITGRVSEEHYCPGFISGVDRWEAGLKKGS